MVMKGRAGQEHGRNRTHMTRNKVRNRNEWKKLSNGEVWRGLWERGPSSQSAHMQPQPCSLGVMQSSEVAAFSTHQCLLQSRNHNNTYFTMSEQPSH